MKRNEIKRILREIGLIPSRFRGQSFLINERIAEKIVDAVEPEAGKRVLEIGTGLGILTRYLLKKKVVVYGIEIEKKLYQYLKGKFPDVELTNQDFLRIEKFPLFRKIIGNIPYIKTNEILYKILSFKELPNIIVLTLQKEVGERLVSMPESKNYSSVSVNFQTFFECKYLFSIPPGEFFPRPEVVSGVVKMKRKGAPEVNDKEGYIKFVQTIFKQRRKTIKNNLRYLDIEEEKIKKLLLSNSFNLKARAESLSPEEILKLYKDYIRIKS